MFTVYFHPKTIFGDVARFLIRMRLQGYKLADSSWSPEIGYRAEFTKVAH